VLIESVTLVGFAFCGALLLVAVLELRELRKSMDAMRSVFSDMVGIPQPDLIEKESATAEPGVMLSRQFEELLSEYKERESGGNQ